MEQCDAMIQLHDAFVGLTQQLRLKGALAVLASLLLCHCSAPGGGVHHDVLTHGAFATVRVYQPPHTARFMVLLLSGDGGWGDELEQIAYRLTLRDALVAGIDVREWLAALESAPAACLAPGAYLADLERFLADRYHLATPPAVLVGHSAGASLVYVALAQGRPGDFSGGLTLSFCADLDLERPLCAAGPLRSAPRRGGVRLVPGGALPVPWTDLHGIEDRECPAAEARAFIAGVPGAQFVPLPGEGHSYAHLEAWWPRFAAAWQALAPPRPVASAAPLH